MTYGFSTFIDSHGWFFKKHRTTLWAHNRSAFCTIAPPQPVQARLLPVYFPKGVRPPHRTPPGSLRLSLLDLDENGQPDALPRITFPCLVTVPWARDF